MDASTFLVLADPTRLRLVELLRDGERPVKDLVARLDVEQSGVSRHLAILREAGFVTVRPDGQQRLYALRAERFRELDRWLDRYRDLWEARLDRLGAALEQSKRRKKETR